MSSFLAGLATGAQSGLQMGAGIQDARFARKVKAGETPGPATGLYGRYREVRDAQAALQPGQSGSTASSPAAASAQNQPEQAPTAATPAPIQVQTVQMELPGRDIEAVAVERPAAGGLEPPEQGGRASFLNRFKSIIQRARP